MAKKPPKITIIPSKKILDPSQAVLLASNDWKHMHSMIKQHGPTPETLSRIAPTMARLLRKRERLLPETERLPQPIMDLLCRTLAGRTSKPSGHQ